MRLIEKIWFKQHAVKWLLLPLLIPFSVLFLLLSKIRRYAYRRGLLKSFKVNAPVIVVGNISVGGNGKTPVVIHLVELTRELGLKPGVISRGYGGKAEKYPYQVNDQSSAAEAGDEPIIIYNRCQIPVVVGIDRIASAKVLIDQGCDVIISDDGLQHYKLQRDFEVIVVDSKRLFGNGFLLPAGPLREGVWRLKQADVVIYNGKRNKKDDATNTVSNVELNMALLATEVCNIATNETITLSDFVAKYPRVNAIAGIGSPKRFFSMLITHNFIINQQQGFVDHHHFSSEDLTAYNENVDIPLLMTEKDAVKCKAFAQQHWWYLPVDVQFSALEQKQLKDSIYQNLPVISWIKKLVMEDLKKKEQ